MTITQVGIVTEFVYDGVGRRVKEKLNNTVIKQWIWCDDPQPCEERDASNVVTKRFYGQGEQIGGTSYFFVTDHLGSVREMTDSSGTIRARYDYDPYGRTTKTSGDLEADFGFTGFYRHQASGLSLTLYRAYDANLGRWLSRDPIGEDGGINLYGYVENNPLIWTDPDGRFGIAINVGRWSAGKVTVAVVLGLAAIDAVRKESLTQKALEELLRRLKARNSCPLKMDARTKGDRLKSTDDKLQQLEEVEKAQQKVRQDKRQDESKQLIDDISKSQQNAKKQLRDIANDPTLADKLE